MFIKNLLETSEGRKIFNTCKDSTTYTAYYEYWMDQLFERIMRLFVWENTDPVPAKEIEQRLLISGHGGVFKYQGEVTVAFGSFFGVTKYMDEFPNYIVRSPIFSITKAIDKDVVVINNTSLRNDALSLVHHYATLLAHTEASLAIAMINIRDAGGVPIVGTEKQKNSIRQYQNKLYNGQFDVVSDIGMLGVEYGGTNRNTSQDIKDIMDVRSHLLKSFYSDIGVRSAFEKRSNAVEAEVEADSSLLLLNLSDMITCRQEGVKKVNKMFGTNWKVHIAEEIDYALENERVQFDTRNESHVAEGDGNIENSDDK